MTSAVYQGKIPTGVKNKIKEQFPLTFINQMIDIFPFTFSVFVILFSNCGQENKLSSQNIPDSFHTKKLKSVNPRERRSCRF
jgi:hypothetical protein